MNKTRSDQAGFLLPRLSVYFRLPNKRLWAHNSSFGGFKLCFNHTHVLLKEFADHGVTGDPGILVDCHIAGIPINPMKQRIRNTDSDVTVRRWWSHGVAYSGIL